jgi:hypothetical protein
MTVELIPGTALPLHGGPQAAQQIEGRGDIQLTPQRQPPSLLEKISDPDFLSAAERVYMEAAIRAFDKRKILEKEEYFSVGDQTDATTGNCVVSLFEVPAGKRGDVVQVLVDAPGSAAITPAAPFANAASWAFICIAPASSGLADSAALRQGLAAFAPTSAGGPILPGQWTFNDSNAPVAWGGEQVYFVLVGGSVAAVVNLQIQVTVRINLYSHA